MATTKTETKELTVEDRLKAIYHLQTVLTDVDKIKTLRGELPLEVQDLEDEIVGLQTRIENYNNDIEELKANVSQGKNVIEDAKKKIAQYNEQQKEVRNNREFDALTKEITYQNLEIELNEKHIKSFLESIESKQAELVKISELFSERCSILEEKKSELYEIISETKQEEEVLRNEAKQLETLIDPRLLTAFKRIRKNARNGLAVVTVDRDACGGCFNKIPPQRQLDIRNRKKIIVCEFCGRILVDKEIND